jgi:hypothetical protein
MTRSVKTTIFGILVRAWNIYVTHYVFERQWVFEKKICIETISEIIFKQFVGGTTVCVEDVSGLVLGWSALEKVGFGRHSDGFHE